MKILLVGIGNKNRCDDAIGLLIAEKIKSRNYNNVDVIFDSGNLLNLLDILPQYNPIIFVDAITSNKNYGSLIKIDCNKKEIPKYIFTSSHLIGISQFIRLAKMLNKFPQNCILFGIEGKNFSFGEKISEEIITKTDFYIKEIEKEINYSLNPS